MENVGQRSYESWVEEGSPTHIGDKSLNGYERNALFWNRGGGRFEEVGYIAGCDRIEDGRGLATADFDRDGQIDLLLHNFERSAVLLMGRGATGNWLQIDLEGVSSARDAAGAAVTVLADGKEQLRHVALGSGYLSTPSTVLHFGVGDAVAIDRVSIEWPSGLRQTLEDLPINQRLAIREGDAPVAVRAVTKDSDSSRIVPTSDGR